jgi:hypothetical protein
MLSPDLGRQDDGLPNVAADKGSLLIVRAPRTLVFESFAAELKR